MNKSKSCPKCTGRMINKPLEIGTTETGLPYWGIYGVTLVAYVCNKCGYIELYNREKTTRVKVKREKVLGHE